MVDAPKFQYAQTADGVNIAFWSLGNGPTLLHLDPLPSVLHYELMWRIPEARPWYEMLAEHRTVVGFDGRGTGMSDKGDFTITLEDVLSDIEAVVDHIGADKLSIFTWERSGPAAMTFAARHSERVERLVLMHSWLRTSEFLDAGRSASIHAMLEKDWFLFTENVARTAFGWSSENGARIASLVRELTTPASWKALLEGGPTHDASAAAGKIDCPTLILHRPRTALIDVSFARQLAAAIPDSRLALLEGESSVPFADDVDAVIAALIDFLPADPDAGMHPSHRRSGETSAFRTILFTDIESHTAMMQRLGDVKGRDVLREHERITRAALAAHGGAEVKTMGDGFMASFGSTQKAIECAVALQNAFASAEGETLRIRVGINAGEPIAESDDLFGTSVILAARTAAKANGGEILVTDVVRQLVAGKGFLFADHGEAEMKGFEEPVRLFEVHWQA